MVLGHWLSTIAFLLVALPVTRVAEGSESASHEEARKAIERGNVEWGKARVALDRNTFERMVAPTLQFQNRRLTPQQFIVGNRRLTRDQFIDAISSYPPGVKLTRFDARVLTVMPDGKGWVAIILETLEYERKDSRGKTEKEYWTLVTRDVWRKASDGQWLILFSAEVSHERWEGVPPSLAN
jgi:ketosteroid isomerase-like protein